MYTVVTSFQFRWPSKNFWSRFHSGYNEPEDGCSYTFKYILQFSKNLGQLSRAAILLSIIFDKSWSVLIEPEKYDDFIKITWIVEFKEFFDAKFPLNHMQIKQIDLSIIKKRLYSIYFKDRIWSHTFCKKIYIYSFWK